MLYSIGQKSFILYVGGTGRQITADNFCSGLIQMMKKKITWTVTSTALIFLVLSSCNIVLFIVQRWQINQQSCISLETYEENNITSMFFVFSGSNTATKLKLHRSQNVFF